MQREEYIELVTESSFKDELMILFDKFEQYSSETNEMQSLTEILEGEEFFFADVKNAIRSINGKYKGLFQEDTEENDFNFIIRRLKYLSDEIRNVEKAYSNGDIKNVEKGWVKVLKGYNDVTRNIPILKMHEYIGEEVSIKYILAIAAMPMQETYIASAANIEVDNILKRFNHSKEYVVVAKWYCTYKDFQYALKQHNYSIIHYAGHSNRIGLNFMKQGSNLCKNFFCDIGTGYEFIFLNSCLSYFYEKAYKNNNTVIGYKKYLSSARGKEASDIFYECINNGEDVTEAFYKMRKARAGTIVKRTNRHYRLLQ